MTFLLVLWMGGMRLLDGRITLGSFVMFNTFMGILVWPMIAFGWVVNLMQRGSASMKRIQEYMLQRADGGGAGRTGGACGRELGDLEADWMSVCATTGSDVLSGR